MTANVFTRSFTQLSTDSFFSSFLSLLFVFIAEY